MEPILLPSKLEITPGEKPNEGVLVFEPCYYGYGTTIGNALRRVLLSSLPGAAVTAVKIKGAQHEFSTIPMVKEDVLDIILNLKLLRLRLWSDEPTKIYLKVKGEKKVTAGDFEKNANIEIINTDLHLATLTDKKAEFELEATVERGRGYLPTEARSRAGQELGMIMIDALFSPVRNVGYRVENARVGEITNYDRLTMTIETDGTIDPKDAVKQSSQILLDYFGLFLGKEAAGSLAIESEAVEVEKETPVEISELPEDTNERDVIEEPVVEESVDGDEEKSKPKKAKKAVKSKK